jgi:Sortase domain
MPGATPVPPEPRVTAAPPPGGGRHVGRGNANRRPWATAFAVAGVLAICGGTAGFFWAHQTGRPAAVPTGKPARIVPIPKGHWAAAPQPTARPVAEPVSLEIPAIGVETTLIRLGLTKSGAMQVPPTVTVAGWYTGSPRPGATGAAVIAGHIDSTLGPGVFFRLSQMHTGQLIYVRRADHSLAVFVVTAVRSYPKSAFPTSAVYGAVPNAQLRLITCGGTFDSTTRHYLRNVIVFATLRS